MSAGQVAAIVIPALVAIVGSYFGYRQVIRTGEQRRGVEERTANLAELREVNKALHEEINRVRQDANEDRKQFRDDLDDLSAEVRWLRRDRADQIRRDQAWHEFGAAIIRWVELWMPQAQQLGLQIADPPRPPNLAELVTPETMDPDGRNPRRRWYDHPTTPPKDGNL